MALSSQTATSDGTMVLLNISFKYLDRSEITVFFDGVSTNAWSWVGTTSTQIAFSPAVPNGVEVRVQRNTNIAQLRHRYTAGAAFTFNSLDESLEQTLHIAQEVREGIISGEFVGPLNLNGNQIHGLADGTEPSDAVNLGQLGDAVEEAVSTRGFTQTGAGAVEISTQQKLRQRVGYGEHGTLNQSIAAAGVHRVVDLGGSTVTLTGEPVNPHGVPLVNGQVLVPSGISSFLTQTETYAADINGLMVGREHLAPWWKSVTAGTLQTVRMFGDSTVEHGGDLDPNTAGPSDLFAYALRSAGVNNCIVSNHGVSGSSWSDLNALGLLGTTVKLLVIKYGVNDGAKADPLTTIEADMRAKLAAIRAAPNGSAYDLGILVMGPNSTFRPEYNQDAKWYEQLRKVYVKICREFRCAYFDTYAYLQDTRIAPGLWMDSFDGGQGLHPDAVAVYWIWYEGIKHYVLGDGQWNIQKSNQLLNVGYSTVQRTAAQTPQSFPFGWSQWGVLTSDGWPANGQLMVERQSDGVTRQTLITLDLAPKLIMRTGSGAVWTQWTGIPVPMTSFLNGWTAKGGGYRAPYYQVGSDGFCDMAGALTGGTLGVTCFLLPANARPGAAEQFFTVGGVGAPVGCNVTVFADGNVVVYAAANTTVSLTGVRFRIQ